MRGIRGAGVVMSVAAVALVAGCSAPPTLCSGDVQDQIEAGLGAQVGGEFTVVCPTGVPAEAGVTFTCSVTDESDGSSIDVVVTESDSSGGFEWRVRVPSGTASPGASPSTG
jgi:Domain of unknown function (DUF4333)